jgi:hypothetical protein
MGSGGVEGGGCITLFLHPECIGCLLVEICCVLPFVLSAAEETESPGGGLGHLVGFLEEESRVLRHGGGGPVEGVSGCQTTCGMRELRKQA